MLRSVNHFFVARRKKPKLSLRVKRVLKNFFVQIAFFITLLCVSASVIYAFAQSTYLQRSLLNQKVLEASLAAEGLARESLSSVQIKEYTSLYQTLFNYLKTSQAISVAVVSTEGDLIKGLRRQGDELVALDSGTFFSDYSLEAKQIVTDSTLKIWQPIINKGLVFATVYLEVDNQLLQTLNKTIWQRTVFIMLFGLLFGLTVLAMFLFKPMRALALSTQFALKLNSSKGEVLGLKKLPSQFQSLVDSLNVASQSLDKANTEKNQVLASLNAIFEYSVDAIVVIDRALTIRRFNKAAEEIFGYQASEIIGQPLQLLSPVPISLEMRDAMGATRNIRVPAIHKNGQAILLEVSDNEIELEGERLFISFMRDITQASKQRKAARAVNKENSKLAVIANHTTHAVAIINLQRQHEWINQSFSDMTGYSLEDVIGKTADELLFNGEISKTNKVEIAKKIMNSESFKAEERAYAKHGNELLVVFEGHPVITDGECSHYIIMLQNVTEERQKAKELREAKEQAEQLLVAQQRLLSRVSHEFRTPLNAIVGYSQLLELGELDQEQHDHLRVITKGAKDILGLVDTVMAITPTKTLESSGVDFSFSLTVLIRDLISSMSQMAQRKNIQTVFDESQDVWLFLDAQKLHRILDELLSNAYKFNKDNGLVFVELREKEEKLEIVISDTGIGIEAADLENLFDPFYRLEHASDDLGPGLGLSLASHLSVTLQAKLGASSVIGKGSVFTLSLPKSVLSDVEKAKLEGDYAPF